ncbi:outer membrane lipoprotein carrier protein LolA [Odoribacter sp. OttesenSCG-928-L07]|nr:outer membrane lipoprotein carrier protein LolA [Odoribacter sp. OttesenSCG-928-L07]
MKKITLIILTLIPLLSFSQTAETVVDNFINYISKNEIFEIEFSSEILNENAGINDNLSGTLIMDTSSFRLQIGELMIIDNGKETINYNGDINEVTIFSNNDDDEEIINPFSLIFNYKEHFVLHLVSVFQTMFTIDFLPIEQDTFIKLQIVLDNKTNKISSLYLVDANETEYFYTITKFLPNVKKGRDVFEFNEGDFPEATIIDLRD